MTWLANYWVQKRYRTQVADNKWMCFILGTAQTSMLNALEEAARKSHTTLQITEHSPTHWTAVDPETDTRYVIEKRDDQPKVEGEIRQCLNALNARRCQSPAVFSSKTYSNEPG